MTDREAAGILLNLAEKRIQRKESIACRTAAMKLLAQYLGGDNNDRERANPEA